LRKRRKIRRTSRFPRYQEYNSNWHFIDSRFYTKTGKLFSRKRLNQRITTFHNPLRQKYMEKRLQALQIIFKNARRSLKRGILTPRRIVRRY